MRALIVGIGGQDGAYLARALIDGGHDVWGTSRSPKMPDNIDRLGLAHSITQRVCEPASRGSLAAVIDEARPDEIYYLAAQSSVARSFATPNEALSGAMGFAHLLEATRDGVTRILDASSIDCFGEASLAHPITEDSAFAPRSPYAVGKVAQSTLARLARESEGRFVATAYLGNHESPLRDTRFVTRKVVDTARRIAAGSREVLELGDVGVVRDWGWAPDYVTAMVAMLRRNSPGTFVITTGRSVALSHFVEAVFAALSLDWRAHVRSDMFPSRPLDIRQQHTDPAKAAVELDWVAAHDVDSVARKLALEHTQEVR